MIICFTSCSGAGPGAFLPGSAAQANSGPDAKTIDIDLTALSSTMVYAELVNIMSDPESNMGKTIKISGPYASSYYDQTNQNYHYVTFMDATSCCAQGLEFIWSGDHAYPDDYPALNAHIEIVGVLDHYEELGSGYYYLAVDDITVLGG